MFFFFSFECSLKYLRGPEKDSMDTLYTYSSLCGYGHPVYLFHDFNGGGGEYNSGYKRSNFPNIWHFFFLPTQQKVKTPLDPQR